MIHSRPKTKKPTVSEARAIIRSAETVDQLVRLLPWDDCPAGAKPAWIAQRNELEQATR